MLRLMRFVEVTLAAPLDLRDFYGGALELPQDDLVTDCYKVGETRLRFRVEEGGAFYHFALLVPGDRFDAALGWARERVELLGDVFDFDFWDARAVYFHDPAGSIVELIAHHGLEENGRGGPFAAEELVGFSELGLVGDRSALLRDLEERGLELWSGSIAEPDGLAFVGEKGRTLILAPPGRGWLPTGRPAEPHPVEARLELDGSYSSIATRRL
jgi:catechol 2,3-dioxygenase-like lactoylglutathione lyase family enzyme